MQMRNAYETTTFELACSNFNLYLDERLCHFSNPLLDQHINLLNLLNPFQANVQFLQPFKTSENLWFSVNHGLKSVTVVISNIPAQIKVHTFDCQFLLTVNV